MATVISSACNQPNTSECQQTKTKTSAGCQCFRSRIHAHTHTQTWQTYTFLAVEHVAQVPLGLGLGADVGEDPFVSLVVGAEGHPVQLAVVLNTLQVRHVQKQLESITATH